VLLICAVLLLAIAVPSAHAATPTSNPTPVLAYYYIWFNPSSWNRAKIDTPLLGRYSSDDATVMRQHIRWAKAAGIDGFLVSWKSTPILDERLAELRAVAAEEHFKLGIVYQGLDFHRRALPVDTVEHDLEGFAEKYGDDPVFHIFDRPLVVWSGTWMFSTDQILQATLHVRDKLMVLGSAKNIADYQRIQAQVDGDAYYWSSVDPQSNVRYQEKLSGMAQAVHATGGLWIPPAAPGFDARLIGGEKAVDRKGAATLRAEFAAAEAATPDAIGVISWNEFSENTYVEPSRKYGSTALTTIAELLHATPPDVGGLDSDTPATGASPTIPYGPPVLIGFALALPVILLVIRRRLRRLDQRPGGRLDVT
jgi:hypothetical protein